MNFEGAVKAVRWQFQKFTQLRLKLKTMFWMPLENIDLANVFNKLNHPEFFFIQIGANDGLTGDGLRVFIEKYKWHGILVEPVPYVFERLKDNYRGFENLIFENSAISLNTGYSKFYSISEKDLDDNNLFQHYHAFKIDQLSSFDLNTLMKHSYMHPHFEKLINEVDIPTLSFYDLVGKYKIKKIDLLQIDTEGYDFEILSEIDLASIAPQIIIFEHQHMNLRNYKTLISKMKKSGYKSYKSNWDTVSLKL